MARQSLPEVQSNAGQSVFFPGFEKEMDRLFDQFRTDFPSSELEAASVFASSVFPTIDLAETDDAVEVSAEVPGIKIEDLAAVISGNVLTLKGEKLSDHDKTDDNYRLIERRYGGFCRRIPLGFSPESGAAIAELANGILNLHIKKPVATKDDVQKIEIKKT